MVANTTSTYYPYKTEPVFSTASVASAYNLSEKDYCHPIARPSSVKMMINDIEADIRVDYIEYGAISNTVTFEIRPSTSNIQAITLALINDAIKMTLGDTEYAGRILGYEMKYTEREGHLIHLKMVTEHKKKIEHRYCFKCNSAITYSEFYGANSYKHTDETMKRLWEDSRVELLCCGCYKKPSEFKIRKDVLRCSKCNDPIAGMGLRGICYKCDSKKEEGWGDICLRHMAGSVQEDTRPTEPECDIQKETQVINGWGRRPTLFEIDSNRQKEFQIIRDWEIRPTISEEPEWLTVIKNIKKECEKLIEGEENYD